MSQTVKTSSPKKILVVNGIPMVLIPQKYDQFDVSRTIQKLHAGIFLNKNETDITAEVLRNAVQEAYDNKETFQKGIRKIMDSFQDARNNRTAIYEKVFS